MVGLWRRTLLLATAAFVWLSACSAKEVARTELVLAADTDVALERIQVFSFSIKGPDGRERTLPDKLDRQNPPPRFLSLSHDEGALGPFELSATVSGPGLSLTRRHVVTFVKGQTRVVPLHLAARCIGDTTCTGDQTCSETGCTNVALAADQLRPWSGTPPRAFGSASNDGGMSGPDGGKPGSDGGAQALDASQTLEDASTRALCDGGVSPNLSSDPEHCGGCFRACEPANEHEVVMCVDSKCQTTCEVPTETSDPEWADCDDKKAGCESDLQSDDKHCGGCEKECTGASYRCTAGKCCRKNDATNCKTLEGVP